VPFDGISMVVFGGNWFGITSFSDIFQFVNSMNVRHLTEFSTGTACYVNTNVCQCVRGIVHNAL